MSLYKGTSASLKPRREPEKPKLHYTGMKLSIYCYNYVGSEMLTRLLVTTISRANTHLL